MKKWLLMSILLLGALAAPAAGKPVGVWQGYAWNRLGELVRATVLNPQWSPDKPQQKLFDGTDFDSCSAILYLNGGGMERAPFVFHKWKKDQIDAAEKFVEDGGLLILLADGSRRSARTTGKYAKLLGAKTWGEFTGKAEISAEGWKECGKIPEVFEGMLGGGGNFAALQDLTTAKMLIGNDSGALVAENRIGKGKVIFMNVCLTRSYTPYRQHGGQNANVSLEQLFPFVKKIHAELMAVSPALSSEKRELWDYRPLGPKMIPLEIKKPKLKPVVSARKYEKLPGDAIRLIVNGQAKAFIVTQRIGEKGAADELNDLLKKMTGTSLPLAAPKAVDAKDGKWSFRGKIWDCKIEFAVTPKVEIKAQGNAILIGAPAGRPSLGIQTFMREALGYRMLWPGENGEVYQKQSTVGIQPFQLTDAPYFRQRYVRNSLYRKAVSWKTPEGEVVKVACPAIVVEKNELCGFDPREVAALRKGAGRNWWTAQRLGGFITSVGGGNYHSWQKRYGKTHPEYLALQFDGTRKQKTKDIRICKANPAVVQQSVVEAREMLDKKKNAECYSVSPCDGGYDIFCMCPLCRAWDPTGAPESTHRVFLGRNRPVFRYPGMTDRVFRFTCEIARELKKSHPKIKVKYLAYASYLAPPSYYREAPDNLMVTFVGLEYLNDAFRARDRKYWDFWAGVANELILRPNFLLDGKGLPLVYVHRMAEDIKYCAATGMVGGDFDSLSHHWATLGLNYYVLAQLLWDPSQNVDSIIDDYCRSGFGPAAGEMKAYFAQLEKLTDRLAARSAGNIKELEDLTNSNLPETLFAAFCRVFSDQEMAKLADLLEQAKAKTAADSAERKRVEFITAGFLFTKNRRDFALKYHAAKTKTELAEAAEEQWKFWHDTFVKYPYAVSIPTMAINQYYNFWRQCGWKPGAVK